MLSELITCGRILWCGLVRFTGRVPAGRIAANAMLIRNGNLHLEYGSDFQFYECADLRHSADMVETLYLQEAVRLGVDNVALLSPFRKRTETGVDALNLRLQAKVNPPDPGKPELTLGKRTFRLGDKVMQVKNFEDVSNGDIGKVTEVDTAREGALPHRGLWGRPGEGIRQARLGTGWIWPTPPPSTKARAASITR